MTQPQPQPVSPVVGLLSFLVPGLGQIYQGRVGKGLLFFVSLVGLFFLGQWMGNWQNVYVPQRAKFEFRGHKFDNTLLAGIVNRWHYPGQFFIGVAAWPAICQFYDAPDSADHRSHSTFGTYQRMPPEAAVNHFLVNSDKTPDLGIMYTVIAGVLNILVIYDAYAGPAFPPRSKRTKPTADPATAPETAASAEGASS